MAQIRSVLQEVKTAFTNMSFTPDVPSTNLGAQEYNSGFNVESDIRGVRSVLGEQSFFNALTGTPIYVTGGYRDNNVWYYIVATSAGRWYLQNQDGTSWAECTPGGGGALPGYSDNTNITEAWNGTTLFINDNLNPPMYLTAGASDFVQYSNDPAGPGYIWNYNDDWSALTAGFQRLYSTPNVGSILIAGNLTATDKLTSVIEKYPTTVRWSQAFGLNDGPLSWEPTTFNVANELEVPVRGPVVDGFQCNGNFFVCSYWDTVVFSPISFQSGLNPILGIRPFNQGRGLLNANCWANADNQVFGVDARDIWVFDGQKFSGLGNQRIKNYFFRNLNPEYTNRVFLVNNTAKNQIEIYYPDLTSTGWCNQMISYRYDLNIFNPPRQVAAASHACEGPIWQQLPDTTYDFNPASRTVIYSRGVANTQIVQKDIGHTFVGNVAIFSEFRRDNIHLLPNYSEQLLVHRILPEANNLDAYGLPTVSTGNITVTIGGADSVGQTPTFKSAVTMSLNTSNPWTQIDQNVFRVNSVKLSNTSSTDTWICPGITWQLTPTQDAR